MRGYLGSVPPWVTAAAALLVSYLAGSVPFAFLLTRWVKGVDIRTVGSGNVGATNASRILGRKWFFVVFLLDCAKGALPVLLLAPLAGLEGDALNRLRMACGLAALLGHVFPVFLGFRGGKGVATGAGVLGALAPLASLCALGAFLVFLAVFRYVSLGSIAACLVLGPSAWALGAPGEIAAFCSVVGVLVALLHRKNMARIAAGTEPRVFQKQQKESAGA